MRFAYMDVGEEREQDAEASLIDALQLCHCERDRMNPHILRKIVILKP